MSFTVHKFRIPKSACKSQSLKFNFIFNSFQKSSYLYTAKVTEFNTRKFAFVQGSRIRYFHGNHVLYHGRHEHHHGQFDQDTKDGNKITIIGFAVNVALTGAKAVGGVVCNSASLLADAFHSASDMISDGVTYLSFNKARKPKSMNFPYGYGRFDSLGSMAVSAILVTGALGTGLHSLDLLLSILDIQVFESIFHLGGHAHSHGLSNHPIGLGLAAISVLSKEALYRITMKIGKNANSDVMIANAWHHRSDAWSSLVALAAIGGSMIHPSLNVLDPLGGLIVSAMIAKAGIDTGIPAFKDLIDVAISQETLDQIKRVCRDDKEQIQITKIRGRKMGHYTILDMDIKVPESWTISEALLKINEFKKTILREIEGISEINVQIVDRENEYIEKVAKQRLSNQSCSIEDHHHH